MRRKEGEEVVEGRKKGSAAATKKINKKNLDLALGNLVNKLLVITNSGVTARQKESNKML
jgi:hypothetical protein